MCSSTSDCTYHSLYTRGDDATNTVALLLVGGMDLCILCITHTSEVCEHGVICTPDAGCLQNSDPSQIDSHTTDNG